MAQGASLLLAMGLWLAVSSVWAGSFQVSPTLTLPGTSAQCPTTGIQIGAGYRRDGFSRRNFTVQVTAPATLIDANTGNGLPITDIVVTTADAGRSPEWPPAAIARSGSKVRSKHPTMAPGLSMARLATAAASAG